MLIAAQAVLSSEGYSRIPKNLGKVYKAAKELVYRQEYEKAAKVLDRIMGNQKSSPEQKFYSKLLLAQIYGEGKELNKALDVYNGISGYNDYDMPADHVCRYLDLLRRNGFVSRAIEIAKRYHIDLATNDRFVNIESALNSYYQYYQNQSSSKNIPVSTIKTPQSHDNSYAYGIVAYGNDFILLTNRYDFNQAQSFYTNAKMVLLSNKRGKLEYSAETFNPPYGFVQHGPATFFNQAKTVIFTANQYMKYNTGNRASRRSKSQFY